MMKKITLIAAVFAAFSMNAQVFDDDFDSYTATDNVGEDTDLPAGYIGYDVDGDGFGWGLSNTINWRQDLTPLYTENFLVSASFITTGTDANGNGGQGALSPDNILVLPQITIPAGSTSAELSYTEGTGTDPNFFAETYDVIVTTSSAEADILAATPVFTTTIAQQGAQTITVDLVAFEGQDIFISFRHRDTTDEFILGLDNVIVTAETLSVDDVNSIGFSQYMDTASNLNLRANVALENVELFNIVGQQVMSQKLSSNDASISLSSLTDGVYIARVTVEGQTETFKIIKR